MSNWKKSLKAEKAMMKQWRKRRDRVQSQFTWDHFLRILSGLLRESDVRDDILLRFVRAYRVEDAEGYLADMKDAENILGEKLESAE